MAVLTFDSITSQLQKRAAAKTQPVVKAAAGDTPAEKDPAEKGVVAIPKDQNADNATMKLPPKTENGEVTPVTTVAPAKTVDGPEKVATKLQTKAAGAVSAIQALLKSTKSATASEITPALVSDKGNENKDTHPADSTDKGPAKKGQPDPAVKDAAPAPDATDPNAKKVEAPKGDGKGALPAPTTNADDVSTKKSEEGCMTGDPKAAGMALDFDPSFHFKLASAILATEEGRTFAQQVLEAQHGAAEASDLVKAAAFMEQQAQVLEQMEQDGVGAAEQAFLSASPEEQEAIVKLANVHATAKSGLNHEMLKLAYDDGAATAAGMGDAGMLDKDPGAETDNISEEDIVAVLDQLVQSGQIKPEEAQAILQELAQGGQGEQAPAGAAGPDGGMDPNAMGAMGADASPEAKEAFATVKAASAIVDAVLAAKPETK
jgi:hypothetical protein